MRSETDAYSYVKLPLNLNTKVTQVQPCRDGRSNSHKYIDMLVGDTEYNEIDQRSQYKDTMHHSLRSKKKKNHVKCCAREKMMQLQRLLLENSMSSNNLVIELTSLETNSDN